jgi:23S rRNA (guanosine2251-2'-O)-methyltransferase
MDLIIALDNVRSLHNVGAIFRTADGAGVSRIILGGLTPTPPRHEISKTALGAADTMPWEHSLNLLATLGQLKTKGYRIYALELTADAVPIHEAGLSLPAVLVVGHEREGVQPDILALADGRLLLPMRGRSVRSLNVSVAAGVAAYEFARRFGYNKENL